MIIYYVVFAFNIWMFIDAMRRRAEVYWLLIIALVPFGGFIYFAMVKLKDFTSPKVLVKAGGGKQLDDLREKVEHSPSVSNKLQLADALEENDQCDDATPLYREVLHLNPEDKQALHGLARCAMSRQDFAEATELLDRLLRLDNSYRDYSAALDYAEALWHNGQREDTLDLLEGLISTSSRMNHHVALAHYLMEDKRHDRAQEVLGKGLSLYDSAPAYVQKRDKSWADRALRMKKKLPPLTTLESDPS